MHAAINASRMIMDFLIDTFDGFTLNRLCDYPNTKSPCLSSVCALMSSQGLFAHSCHAGALFLVDNEHTASGSVAKTHSAAYLPLPVLSDLSNSTPDLSETTTVLRGRSRLRMLQASVLLQYPASNMDEVQTRQRLDHKGAPAMFALKN